MWKNSWKFANTLDSSPNALAGGHMAFVDSAISIHAFAFVAQNAVNLTLCGWGTGAG